jgi:hypothetical protein
MVTLGETLRKKDIEVQFFQGGIAYLPADNVDQELQSILHQEGRDLYKQGLKLTKHLEGIKRTYSVKELKQLRNKLFKEWPMQVPGEYIAWNTLMVWVNGILHVTEALNPADVSFYGRNLDDHWQPALINKALLYNFLLDRVMRIPMH